MMVLRNLAKVLAQRLRHAKIMSNAITSSV